ncbi:MAG TPA: type III-B CRISPR module RAMP protein Cmr1 [Thermodesulfobacteriota bacterium]|nr:type III-B CRISPR module RAMP protein Cmr1 [Thermodesulfobacteriota bacterium]
MNKVSFELEVVTPLFLGGADGKTAELRPPSIRGAMRFWFRAMMGGIVGGNVDALKKLESNVFGSTDKASCFNLSLRGLNISKGVFSKDSYTGRIRKPGLLYLGFSLDARRGGERIQREYIKGGSRFILEIKPQGDADSTKFKAAFGALWLLINFGSLGSRSRRGFGCLSILNDLSIEGLPSFKLNANTPSDLVIYLKNGIAQIKALYQTFYNKSGMGVKSSPSFPMLSSTWSKIFVLNKTSNNWEEILDQIGSKLQEFRNHKEPDYTIVKDILQGKSEIKNTVKRASFGLPLPFFFRSLGNRTTLVKGTESERRASPLYIKVIRLANGSFTILITFFKNEFLSSSERLFIQGVKLPLPDYSLIDEFVSLLPLQEVKL